MRNLSNSYGKQLLDTAAKTGLDALKTASKKVVHKGAEATGEFIVNEIPDKIVKPDDGYIVRICNLIEYSDNCSMTPVSFWNFHRDEVNDDANKNNNGGNYRINTNKTVTSKSFEYKTKMSGNTPADNSELNAEVVFPLKYMSNFWRSLNLPLMDYEMELEFSWSRKCVISEISRTAIVAPNPSNSAIEEIKTDTATFQIISANFYVPAVTLSINHNMEFLETRIQKNSFLE